MGQGTCAVLWRTGCCLLKAARGGIGGAAGKGARSWRILRPARFDGQKAGSDPIPSETLLEFSLDQPTTLPVSSKLSLRIRRCGRTLVRMEE